MRFAVALPRWGYVIVFAAAVLLAWVSYARLALTLNRRQRALLTALRALTLVLLVAFLLRPVLFVEAQTGSDSLVPILVDVSRSMRIADAGADAAANSTRIERAAAVVKDFQQLAGSSVRTELVT